MGTESPRVGEQRRSFPEFAHLRYGHSKWLTGRAFFAGLVDVELCAARALHRLKTLDRVSDPRDSRILAVTRGRMPLSNEQVAWLVKTLEPWPRKGAWAWVEEPSLVPVSLSVDELRRADEHLREEGLAIARVHLWIQDERVQGGGYPQALLSPTMRSATREHTVGVALCVSGTCLALIDSDRDHLEQLEEACPTSFLTPRVLVAIQDGVVWISTPGSTGERWRQVPHEGLAFALASARLCRDTSALLWWPDAGWAHAAYASVQRLSEMQDGLVCIERSSIELMLELALHLTAVLVPPIVLTPSADQDLFQIIERTFAPCVPLARRPRENGVSVLSLSQFAQLHEWPGHPNTPIIASSVDAGFRGAQGFAARLLLPEAPWIAMTALLPDGCTHELLHAYANPRDEDGILAVSMDTSTQTPVQEERWRVLDTDSIVAMLRDAPTLRALVLVPSADQAAEFAESAMEAGLPVHDATTWGAAYEGWHRLREGEAPAIVVRTSFPFWIGPRLAWLDLVCVDRDIGPVTRARLRHLLARPHGTKRLARLVDVENVSPDRLAQLTARERAEREEARKGYASRASALHLTPPPRR